ncbi:MAG: NAD-dependent dehydratase [Deltaproteobacteria bacterium RBG_13_65_10]|nr:MAG: NAD-dependent dehydratase [Deltaproteobacteria bacterium RBG_13_65_10]
MSERKDFFSRYAGTNALITGGLGFIGSNLAIRLVNLGASVTIADAMIPDYGGNLFNIEPVRKQVFVNYCDIRDPNAMNWLVRDKHYVFHLAGQVCHITSLQDPFPDIDMNIKGTAVVMEAVRRHNPRARVVYSGTRGQYGPSVKLPVNEEAPTNPKGIYEISNLTAEKIIQVYNDTHGIHSVLLRITNVYGPRAQMKHSRFGVANWFVRLALDNEMIKVFGDGKILRDFLYVDDCVEAILVAAAHEDAVGEIFNVGVDTPTTFLDLARTLIEVSGSGRWEFAPFTVERKAQEPGDFYSDITKIRKRLGWEPATPLDEGLRRTVEYYRKHKHHYWE